MKRIEINFKNTSIAIIQSLLLDYFAWDKSSEYPMTIMHDVDVYPSNTKGYVAAELRKFRVVEINDYETLQHNTFAKVIFSEYPSGVVLFFEEEYDDVNESDWGKVEKFVNHIVEKAKHLKFEVDVAEAFEEKSKKRSAIDEKFYKKSYMQQFYKYFNPQTARGIIDAIPAAWLKCDKDGGRWGPQIISEVCPFQIHPTTVGRYLNAFKKAGLVEIEDNGIIIKIP